MPTYNFTTEDLIQYMYKETSSEKTAAIESALATDYNLREAMEVLSASQDKLNDVKFVSPRMQTLENIFAYAEKSVEELHA